MCCCRGAFVPGCLFFRPFLICFLFNQAGYSFLIQVSIPVMFFVFIPFFWPDVVPLLDDACMNSMICICKYFNYFILLVYLCIAFKCVVLFSFHLKMALPPVPVYVAGLRGQDFFLFPWTPANLPGLVYLRRFRSWFCLAFVFICSLFLSQIILVSADGDGRITSTDAFKFFCMPKLSRPQHTNKTHGGHSH